MVIRLDEIFGGSAGVPLAGVCDAEELASPVLNVARFRILFALCPAFFAGATLFVISESRRGDTHNGVCMERRKLLLGIAHHQVGLEVDVALDRLVELVSDFTT